MMLGDPFEGPARWGENNSQKQGDQEHKPKQLDVVKAQNMRMIIAQQAMFSGQPYEYL
jgi:hypothetical protein